MNVMIEAQENVSPQTYAVVVGITQYQNTSLPKLQFADKDAALFAAYLQSKSGGSVAVDNIKLLVNTDATIAAVYDALNWLQEKCRPGDKAYFYFSGHGDVETKNNYSLGYLLAYNSPNNNYRNNAISIEDINNTANNLSLKNKATVVLITDACHTGKLAGDFYKGKQLVASELQIVLNNEVRLAACAANQEAAESLDWGGGRGVFSYYLLKGLKGMADFNHNDTIQLNNLNKYLDSVFAADKILIRDKHQQQPVLDGNPYFVMSTVDTTALRLAEEEAKQKTDTNELPEALRIFKPVGIQPIDYFFSMMKAKPLESRFDFSLYKNIAADSFPLTLVTDCITYQQQLQYEKDSLLKAGTMVDDSAYEFMNIDTLNLLKTQLLNNKPVVKNFNEKFIRFVHDEAQDMVNAYLIGDAAELERRQYYYTGDRSYSYFLSMLNFVVQITPQNHYLYRLLKVNEAYIGGLVARMEMATGNNTSALLKTAFAYQQKALKLEPYAAYIHNEIGNLYVRKQMYDSADYHFKLATVISPTWSIPFSNRARLYLIKNNYSKAAIAIETSDSLQPNLAYTLMNAGLVMEKQKNLLAAESYYLKAIAQNNVHFFPYEHLANIYLNTGDYEDADWYMASASMRKKDFAINSNEFRWGIELGGYLIDDVDVSMPGCDSGNQSITASAQIFVKLYDALKTIRTNKDSSAQMLYSIINANTNMPMAHHYLGKILYQQNKFKEAASMLVKAIDDYKTDSSLSVYLNQQLQQDNRCLILKLMHYSYNTLEDYYLLAAAYEKLGLNDKALQQYSTISLLENEEQNKQANFYGFDKEHPPASAMDSTSYNNIMQLAAKYEKPVAMGGYIKAELLHEKKGDYAMAEKKILQQVEQNRNAGFDRGEKKIKGPYQLMTGETNNYYWLAINRNAESYAYLFYQRMLRLFPRDAAWQEKAGMFLYNRLALTFRNLSANEYASFYQSMSHWAYPFLFADDTSHQIDVVYMLPGTGDRVDIPMPDYDPVATALHNLQLAVQLSGDTEPKPELLQTIAIINSWMGNKEDAIQYFKKSIAAKPGNIEWRSTLINYCLGVNESPLAMQQLKILYTNYQTTTTQKLELANCYILTDSGMQASAILQNIHPVNDSEKTAVATLYAKMYQLKNNNAKALFYLKNLPHSFDSNKLNIQENKSVIERLYAIARLNALLKQPDSAFSYLEQAFKAGLDYTYLIQFDPAWNNLRPLKKWKLLLNEYNEQLQNSYDNNSYRFFKSIPEQRIPKLSSG